LRLDILLIRLQNLPIGSQYIENKRGFSPELIELIEQEGAARFLVKIWGEKGGLVALFRSILHRCASGTGAVRWSRRAGK
jgi:hypothetical protein